MCEREVGIPSGSSKGKRQEEEREMTKGRTKARRREGKEEEGINEREGGDNNNNTQYQKSMPKRNIVQVHQKKRWKAVHRRLVKS